MVSMSPGDHDVLHFLWVDNSLSTSPNIIIYRFAQVVLRVSSISYLLNSTIQHHLIKYSSLQPDIVAKLLESFYVDDLVCGGKDEDEALKHYTFARDALSHASFNLRKFITNSCVLQDWVKQEEPHWSKETADVTPIPHCPLSNLKGQCTCIVYAEAV